MSAFFLVAGSPFFANSAFGSGSPIPPPVNELRITEDGQTRITEDNIDRIIE